MNMLKTVKILTSMLVMGWAVHVRGEVSEKIVDIPTRPRVTQRMLVLSPENPKAAAILLAGGHGGLQISAKGSFGWGKGNFLVRSRQLFVDEELMVVHHVDDGCSHCRFSDTSKLMDKLGNSPKKELLPVKGGVSQGDPCEARSYHGFNGVEAEVVKKISAWMLEE